MTDLRYRLFLAFQRVNLALRRIGFQLYLNRRKAHLDGADLSYLNLGGVNLSGASLRGANLSRAPLYCWNAVPLATRQVAEEPEEEEIQILPQNQNC